VRELLVGGGPQEDTLRAQADALGLGDHIVFTGRVPHAQVPRYYNLIDVLAYPRKSMRLTELFTPLKLLEVMAQGRMFVASNATGHRELVRDGETGFLFEAGSAAAFVQAIGAMLARRSESPRIGRQAREFVETQRTWARGVARCVDVYNRVIAARRGEPAIATAGGG